MSEQQELIVRPQTDIEQHCQKTLLDVLSRYKKSIDAMLPKMIDAKRFAWLAVTAVRGNPRLAECSPASFINAVMLATQMGLEIRRDSAYLVPFGKECTLLIDYKGKMGLARRSGKVGGIQAVTIRENDDFSWIYTVDGVKFHHNPFPDKKILSAEERGRIIGCYAFAHLVNGGMQFREPMSIRELDRIRRRSRAGVSSMTMEEIFAAQAMTEDGKQAIWQTWQYKDPRRQPWVTDIEAMCLKTVLHSLFKSLPLSPEEQLSQAVDEGYETGKQPNILADMVDIDPVDEKPMVEASPEEQERVLQEKLAAGREAAAAKKAARPAKPRGEAVRAYDSLEEVDPLQFEPGHRIYVQNVLYASNAERTAWQRVEQAQ